MVQVRRGSATTTYAIRAAIQRSQASAAELSRSFGINPKTVLKRGLADYHGKGSHEVEAVRYVPREEAIWINQTKRFAPVPPQVWEFRIGGYQVLDKYLKARRSRTLSLDEINHVARVADALAFTIDQMQRIDEAYRAAFPDRT